MKLFLLFPPFFVSILCFWFLFEGVINGLQQLNEGTFNATEYISLAEDLLMWTRHRLTTKAMAKYILDTVRIDVHSNPNILWIGASEPNWYPGRFSGISFWIFTKNRKFKHKFTFPNVFHQILFLFKFVLISIKIFFLWSRYWSDRGGRLVCVAWFKSLVSWW